MNHRLKLLLFFFLLCFACSAQRKTATVSGTVVDEEENRIAGASVTILGTQRGTTTNDSGFFLFKVAPDKAFAIVVSYTGYKTTQQNFLLSEGETEHVSIRLERGAAMLQDVTISDNRARTETGLIRPNPKSVLNLPVAITGVESLIKVFVGSNNELTSQYNVRGGSYDENLIYVNDFEIFRPYLVRSGQQEGLSFINPELVRNISFYNGGFQARYSDKLSSVLDIQYNKPRAFGGSAYASLLEQGLHLEGVKNKFTYLIGARNRSNDNLLRSQPTQGAYVPSSSDLQALLTYQLSEKWSAELLANTSSSKFSFIPQSSQLSTAVLTPFIQKKLAADFHFEGQEKDAYSTAMLGLSTTYAVSKKLRLKWLASRFQNTESENIDITGAYQFGEAEVDQTASDYGEIVNPLGVGAYQNFARNHLKITNYNLSHRGVWEHDRDQLLWGIGIDKTIINDKLNEWEYNDSAGYSVPYNPSLLQLNNVTNSTADLNIYKGTGFVQHNFLFADSTNTFTLQTGLRANYNNLNNEFLIAPRVTGSWKPSWKRDVIFKAAIGAYHQPPFYREMRRYDGTLNTGVRAQRSWQAVAGLDYNFKSGSRALRLTTEAYYKMLSHVVPYDIDNVRIRYSGENNAKAYATGIEVRLFGDVVKDAESWISFGLMRTRENLNNDFYTTYTLDSANKPIDSARVAGGWFRRPTDRLLTFGAFFQDYLSTNKNFKVYLNLLYGSNLPYNIPGSVRYRNALRIEPYIRADIGFSALLLDSERGARRSHSPFRNFNAIWASLEVFNLIDRANTISYLLIKDFTNNTYALPNRLTPRLLNFKIVARW